MELIFLNRSTFQIADYAYVSDDFELIMDSVVYQKSFFVVNKTNINATMVILQF